MSDVAVEADGLGHVYGDRVALNGVSFAVRSGEIFGLLGPNGGGKTTLFRILATLIVPSSGRARVLGRDVMAEPRAVRRALGVVFQAPALDGKLTVAENLRHHGHLYGWAGRPLRERMRELLSLFHIEERARDRVETLSGGLRRRVELAKGLLPRPEVLIMDEPSTGLDPGARLDLWSHLKKLHGVTVVLTTHLLEEAERCDRLGILAGGRMVASGTPDALKAEISGDVVTVAARDPAALGEKMRGRFEVAPAVIDRTIRIEIARGHEFVTRLIEAFPGEIESVTVGKPTLEDVFVHRTGRRLMNEDGTSSAL